MPTCTHPETHNTSPNAEPCGWCDYTPEEAPNPYLQPVTWYALEKAWFHERNLAYAGPSEKHDFRVLWEAFRAEHEKPKATHTITHRGTVAAVRILDEYRSLRDGVYVEIMAYNTSGDWRPEIGLRLTVRTSTLTPIEEQS